MKDLSHKLLWVFVCFCVLVGAVWEFYPLKDATDRFEKLPVKGFGFISKDLPMEGVEAEYFAENDTIKRLYYTNKQSVLLTVIDGTKNRHVVHDPLFCFRGAGWDVAVRKPIPIWPFHTV